MTGRYKRALHGLARRPSAWWLIGANLIPLVGVLFLGWDLRAILVLYWAESAVIGGYNIVKMIVVGGIAGVPLAMFFVVHFGIFMFVHLAFIGVLTRPGLFNAPSFADSGFLPDVTDLVSQSGFILALVALVVSHGVSFVLNFLRRERTILTLPKLFIAPYGRIVVMHIAILASAGLVMLFDAPTPLLIILVVLKIVFDLVSHALEHAAGAATRRWLAGAAPWTARRAGHTLKGPE